MANYNSDYTGAQIDSAVSRANSSDVTAGTVAASKAVVVDSNKDITGFRHITATGTVTAANVSLTGNVDLGDASGDTVTITGSIDSNLIPAADDTYDIGSSSYAWQDVYLEGNLYFSDATEIDVASGDLTVDVAGDIEFNADGGDFSFKDDSSTLATISSSGVVTGTMTITSASITDSSGSISFGNENLTTSGTIQYGSISDGSITITAFVDEDGMDSNSATLVPTQQSVKAYVDAQVTAQDLDFQGDSGGALNIDLDSETLTIAGGEGIDTSGSSNTITIAGEDATTSNKGIASFSSDNFDVSSGAVTIKDDGVILATETTGDYVQNITGGTGIDSTGATSGENIAHTLSVDLNELTTETSIADDDFIAMVDATDNASGKITFENLEDAIFASVSGDITITEAGVAQIANNAVDLTTHSTGNYVATIADSGGGGITVANSGAESAAVTLELDIKGLTDDAIASGDFIAFSDEGESGDPANRGQIDDVATLFAGTGLTASSAVIGVDASQTQITSVGTLGAGAISSGFGAIDNGSSTANFGATTVDSLSVSDGNVTNVGDIALDSISADDNDINVAITNNRASAFEIKQGSDKYFGINTTTDGDVIQIGTGISGTAITLGHSTSEITVADNLTVTGNLKVNGDQVYQNVTQMAVNDPIISLQTGTDGANLGADTNKDVGLAMFYHNGSAAKTAFLGFDDSAGKLTFIPDATISSEVASGTAGTIVANLEGNVTGNVTGNTSGTALTVTQAAQTAITSVGTLTALQVDNININGNTIISSDTNGHINLTPNGSGEVNISKVDIDAGTIDGATIATSDVTVGSGKTLDVSGGTLTLADDQIPMAKTAIVAGTGISLSTNTLNVDASQTGLESLLNTSLVAGRDAHNQIKFSTDDQIIFRVADGDGVTMKASGEIEATSLDISGDIDVDGTTNLDVVDIDGAVTITTATNYAMTIKSTDADAADIFRIIADDDGALFAFSKDASDDAEMYLYDGSGNANVQISGNNVSYFKGGNVGINEAAPAELLEISNSSSPAIQLTQTGGTEYNGIIRLAGNDLEIRGSSGTMELYNGSADGDSSTLAMSINSSQNFLFGGSEAIFNNATGDYNLYIGGSNSSNSRLYFKDVADGGAGFIDYDHADNSMIFGTDGTTRMRISSTGAVTAPTAPAFSATPDGTQSNPGNNTKIEFNTEIFDQGANFTNDTFTAPVTGRYQLNVSIRTNGGFDTATDYQGFQLVTSNRSYTTEVDPDIFDSAGGFYTFQLSVLADMDASDTALINHFFNGGTVTLDIVATSTFSGYLAC